MADFNIPLDISSLKIIEQTPDTQGNYILTVESTKTESTCHKYRKSATKRYGYSSHTRDEVFKERAINRGIL